MVNLLALSGLRRLTLTGLRRLTLGGRPFAFVEDSHIIEHVPRLVPLSFLFQPVLRVRADGIHGLIRVVLHGDLIVRKEALKRQSQN